ncbi:MAG: TetR/AcrR family transcriptional regulator [Coleofasciculaceae cyanobacterium SM2_3_26]|nr:TetR/AcrR family transcriptional regulator [Coleofasciculaceae cyanobacterium SM2_3_26]
MKENTVTQILDTAQQVVQLRGYNAFSYADISDRVGIRKASIHYYFPSKGDLGRDLIQHYRQSFQQRLAQVRRNSNVPREQLVQFVALYREGLLSDRLCLCGMLAADYATLPDAMRIELQGFFADTEAWLVEVFRTGCEAGLLDCKASVETEAKLFLAQVQGAQLTARASGEGIAAFDVLADRLVQMFNPG